MNTEQYFPGLEGVIAGETAISNISGELRYRGYSISDLAAESSFTETAFLLLHGELPTEEQYADFKTILYESAEVDATVINLIQEIPLHVGLMDVLRTGISLLGHFDPQSEEESRAANIGKATRLLAQIPILIAARYRSRNGQELLTPDPEMSFAASLFYMLTGKEPTPLQEKTLDVSLIMYAEHEFNASTFTARVITSTQSDLHSAAVGAVGALKGPLHGGANERVLEILEEIGTPANAENWIRTALSQKRRIMGFGHRVYKDGDPRAVLLKHYAFDLAAATGDMKFEDISEIVERILWQEKKLPPNLDWPTARVYHYLGLETDLFTPLFVASRISGWAAHVIEQAEHNRLIRPSSRYIGPAPRDFRPLDER